MVQRDLISEQRLSAIIGDDARLRDVADQLILHASANYTVKAYWITQVTGLCPQSITALRDEGAVRAENMGTKVQPRWRYDIVSFMAWYKTR